MNYYPGRQSCGGISLDKTIGCLCNDFDKDEKVRAGAVESRCRIDHNIAYACLETLAPHIGETDIWGGICPDRRRLIRKTLYEWWLDSPKTSFDWQTLGLIIFGFVLNLSVVAWQLKNRRESEVGYTRRTDKWVVVGQITAH